jgi:hypothetical protein
MQRLRRALPRPTRRPRMVLAEIRAMAAVMVAATVTAKAISTEVFTDYCRPADSGAAGLTRPLLHRK